MITGGVAKYVELLIEAEAYTLDAILDEIFSDNSNFLDEGKNVLIDEFGKDYGNYFSILSLIASSKTSRVEMESILEMQIGGFLDRLENDFGIICKVRPILSKPNTRSVKYKMNDNFLSFWFRFIYKYRGAIETGKLEYVKNIVLRDYTMYSGTILEKYFIEKMIAEDNFSAIGTYWEKANLNEIDIVEVNDYEKRLIIAEVKRQADNINMDELKQKATSLVHKLKDYQVEYRALSMTEM
jgi:AAA+ ATPase superfamily predicted ATPase